MIQIKAWRKMVIFLIMAILFSIMTGLAVTAIDNHTLHLIYGGYTQETPLFIAVQKGFFKEEGLKVDLVKSSFGDLQQQIATGRADGLTADYRIFNSIAMGLKLKLIGGLHSDCIRIIATTGSKIKSVKDLKNKVIGVETVGNGPMVVSSRLLRDHGIDTIKQITWKVIPKAELMNALTEGKIDAVAIWESTKLAPNSSNTVIIFSSSQNKSFMRRYNSFLHFYDSFIGLSDRLIQNDPQTAVAVSRAWLKAARWVGLNPRQAVRIVVAQHLIIDESPVEIETGIMNGIWMPGVYFARENIRFYITEQKKLKILNSINDPNQFFKQVYAPIIPDLNAE